MTKYAAIPIAGGDTATPQNLRKRIAFIASVCDVRSARVLDCGCGSGDYVVALTQLLSADAWGVEYDNVKVRQAKARSASATRVRQGDVSALVEPSGSFDVVIMNEVLEHVPDQRKALAEAHRVLREQGTLVVFAPNRWYPFETHGVRLKWGGAKVPHYVPFIPYIPLLVGNLMFRYWARNYWHGELRHLLAAAGFEVAKVSYLWQTFENISGSQPWVIRKLRPLLRAMSDALEHLPLVKCFGVSQAIVGVKSSRPDG